MGKQKKTRKFSVAKKMITAKDQRIKKNQDAQSEQAKKEEKAKKQAERHIPQVPTAMFFSHNSQLGPPYHVLVDTNFINFSIKNKLEMYRSMMDCLLAKCIIPARHRCSIILAHHPQPRPATPLHLKAGGCCFHMSFQALISLLHLDS